MIAPHLCIVGILLGASAAALAQDNIIERQVKGQAGRDIRIAVFANILSDCTAGQLPAVRLKQPPLNGTVTVNQGRMRTTNYKQCLAVEVPAFVAFYRSSPGFSGQDSVLIEVVSASGKTQIQRYTVIVEKPPLGQGI
ncbi:MAG: hypothetical protein M3R18_05630 [Pseudomonadota bacterium]|nr:hypothetical protein [Pseudomonadota bacterium]